MSTTRTNQRKAERNIGQEILDAVLKIQAGGGKRFTVEASSKMPQMESAKSASESKQTSQK